MSRPASVVADDFAVDLVVQREQRLVLREKRGVVAKSRNRGHRGDRRRWRITQRNVRAEVVVLGVGEDDIAASRLERVRDLAIRIDDAVGRRQRRGAAEKGDADGAAQRTSHCRTSFRSCAEPASVFAKRSSSARAAGLASSLSASTSRRREFLRLHAGKSPAEIGGNCRVVQGRERRGRRRSEVRGGHGIEQEAPRGVVVARELSDLEHGGGRDRFTTAGDDEGR